MQAAQQLFRAIAEDDSFAVFKRDGDFPVTHAVVVVEVDELDEAQQQF